MHGEVPLHPTERAAEPAEQRARSAGTAGRGRASRRRAACRPPTRGAGSRRCRGSNRGSGRCTATSRTRTPRPRPPARRCRSDRAAGGIASPGTATARAGTASRAGTAPSRACTAPERRVSTLWWSRSSCPNAGRRQPERDEHRAEAGDEPRGRDDDAARVHARVRPATRRGRGRSPSRGSRGGAAGRTATGTRRPRRRTRRGTRAG